MNASKHRKSRELRMLQTVGFRPCAECLPLRKAATKVLVEDGIEIGSACATHAQLWEARMDRASRGRR